MHAMKKTALILAAAGCTAGLAVVGSEIDRSPHAHSAVAQGIDLSRLNPDNPVMACFAENMPVPTRFAASIEAMFLEAQLRYNASASWTGTGQGTTLRWSFVPDGLTIPSGIGEPTAPSNTFATFDSQFGGNRALWIQQFDRSFQRWEDLTGLNYQRVTSGGNDWDDGAFWGASGSSVRGDIRIASKFIDGGSGSNVLAYNSFPTNSDMVMDSSNNWGSASSSYRFLRNVVMHEHGHGLGYSHICPAVGISLMEPSIILSFDGPQHDDIRGGMRGYGDINEPDNSTGQATDLGLLASGQSVTLGTLPAQPQASPQPSFSSSLSLDANGEQDFFEFSVSTPAIIDFSLTPVGRNYDDSNQNGNGSCGSGNPIDSRDIANLAFQILDSGGSPIISVDNAQVGQTESTTGLLLANAGNYFIRIYETNTPGETQLYSGQLDVTGAAECTINSECDDGDACTIDECDNGECINFAIVDCNNNGRDDLCEIGEGAVEDCNENGVPDACDVAPLPYDSGSGQLGPIGNGSNQQTTFLSVPDAGDTVTLTFTAVADINNQAERLDIIANGVDIGDAYDELSGYTDCGNPDVDTITVAASTWNMIVANGGGDVVIDILAATSINAGSCGGNSYVEVDVSYDTSASASDANMNGIPDECEGNVACSPADITQTGLCTPGMPDSTVDLSDFSCYLSEWSSSAAIADITTDGVCTPGTGGDGVTLSDFSCFLSVWSAGCP